MSDFNQGDAVEVPEKDDSGSNPELDAILEEATKTKAEEASESRECDADVMTDEKAAEIAMQGLYALVGMANEVGGLDIVIPEKTAVVAVSMFCPLVKKYGAKIKFNPSGVDLDSWMPEVLALGGAGVIGFTVNKQLKAKQIKSEEQKRDGNQPEHG